MYANQEKLTENNLSKWLCEITHWIGKNIITKSYPENVATQHCEGD